MAEFNFGKNKSPLDADAPSSGVWQERLRLAGTALGLVLMAIGLYFVIRLFGSVYSGLKNPEPFLPIIQSWERVVGKDLDVVVGGQKLALARFFAIFILGAGCWVLLRVSISLMWAGARIISWTASDRQAVKRILRQALGKPEKANPEKVNPGNDG
ncbi:MAG: hypothetical protein V1809_04975 [Planctomycetota bacterium]